MSEPIKSVTVFAPAKINLTLHVTGQRADGYHLLDSLVVFASVGDRISVQEGTSLSITAEGPEAAAVPSDMNNLVLKIATLFPDMPGASFLLTKNLPVASGIGGGSADAAAAFRGLMAHRSGGVVDAEIYDPQHTPFAEKLLKLGADIPVCLRSVPTRMRGVGEILEPVPNLPQLFAVLVNPRVHVSTPEVFAALEAKENAQMPPQIPTFSSAQDFILWLSTQRNDLQDPARRLVPEIDAVIAELDACPECLLSRMSGSGATCFGLFTSLSDAERASSDISKRYPNWWVKPVKLGSMDKAALPELN
ncbi:4-(cytidine 5'-diphospho)-2-C-methyl-D-erythritol kinase [Sulfitobacter sp. SK011]|uniref:4-(cytidine 5'-diphospho)-2-C-methyl-D-erythritol kinase n=1 Tax=Sulfitobacter sp. SK011 TaxID=1389004 RepID=UPI000E0BA9EF|nr:4-(cytidine 5'-diphospho)-2-C-methyl-D-erythritol kinase [Sulfitobacter sp. SK011]AXI41129.1 4-(cytidine 5'-diphospho)-2-C-methyl-D-erythritol kinase [Sulfitobacter sp. SK011]